MVSRQHVGGNRVRCRRHCAVCVLGAGVVGTVASLASGSMAAQCCGNPIRGTTSHVRLDPLGYEAHQCLKLGTPNAFYTAPALQCWLGYSNEPTQHALLDISKGQSAGVSSGCESRMHMASGSLQPCMFFLLPQHQHWNSASKP